MHDVTYSNSQETEDSRGYPDTSRPQSDQGSAAGEQMSQNYPTKYCFKRSIARSPAELSEIDSAKQVTGKLIVSATDCPNDTLNKILSFNNKSPNLTSSEDSSYNLHYISKRDDGLVGKWSQFQDSVKYVSNESPYKSKDDDDEIIDMLCESGNSQSQESVGKQAKRLSSGVMKEQTLSKWERFAKSQTSEDGDIDLQKYIEKKPRTLKEFPVIETPLGLYSTQTHSTTNIVAQTKVYTWLTRHCMAKSSMEDNKAETMEREIEMTIGSGQLHDIKGNIRVKVGKPSPLIAHRGAKSSQDKAVESIPSMDSFEKMFADSDFELELTQDGIIKRKSLTDDGDTQLVPNKQETRKIPVPNFECKQNEMKDLKSPECRDDQQFLHIIGETNNSSVERSNDRLDTLTSEDDSEVTKICQHVIEKSSGSSEENKSVLGAVTNAETKLSSTSVDSTKQSTEINEVDASDIEKNIMDTETKEDKVESSSKEQHIFTSLDISLSESQPFFEPAPTISGSKPRDREGTKSTQPKSGLRMGWRPPVKTSNDKLVKNDEGSVKPVSRCIQLLNQAKSVKTIDICEAQSTNSDIQVGRNVPRTNNGKNIEKVQRFAETQEYINSTKSLESPGISENNASSKQTTKLGSNKRLVYFL